MGNLFVVSISGVGRQPPDSETGSISLIQDIVVSKNRDPHLDDIDGRMEGYIGYLSIAKYGLEIGYHFIKEQQKIINAFNIAFPKFAA